MHPARSGDRNVVGGDRHLPDRGIGFLRRGDRYTLDRWNVSGGSVTPPVTGLVDGDPVTTWKDSSGNGHNASQTGSARPIFKTGIIGGKPVVRFTSAGQSGLNLVTSIPGMVNYTAFAVMKAVSASVSLIALASDNNTSIWSALQNPDGRTYATSRADMSINDNTTDAFHVLSTYMQNNTLTAMYKDGHLIVQSGVAFVNSGDFKTIGHTLNGDLYSDGDIAEIILYSGTLAIRAKLLLVLTVLIQTGQIPSTAEADALLAADDLVGLKAYLTAHGIPEEQAADVVTPMAVGDRNNIEAYLGAKYGITQTGGGTAVDPSTVTGLLGWWKADSLAAAVPPFDPTTIAGLKAWWAADLITTPGLIIRRPDQQPGDVIEPKDVEPRAIVDGNPVNRWPDSSGSGNDLPGQGVSPSFVMPTYKTNIVNGKPVVRFSSGVFRGSVTIDVTNGYTFFAVVNWAAGSGNRTALSFEPPGGTGLIQLRADDADLHFYHNDGGWRSASEPGGVNAGSFSVITCQFDLNNSGGPSIWLWRNGTVKASSFAMPSVPLSGANLAAEGFLSGNPLSLFTGDIAEILVYSSILSITDRRAVDAYLGAKYGITIVPTLREIAGQEIPEVKPKR